MCFTPSDIFHIYSIISGKSTIEKFRKMTSLDSFFYSPCQAIENGIKVVFLLTY